MVSKRRTTRAKRVAGTPLVSVLIPTRNNAPFLREALDSIIQQTYRAIELIIVDDGSTDATPEILASYAEADPRVHLLRNDVSLGVAMSLNQALNIAQGSLIARMDTDDISHLDRLTRQVAVFERRPELDFLGTRAVFIDEDGRPLKHRWWIIPEHHDELAWKLLLTNPICHPSVVMRADLLRAAGGYDPAYRLEDMELWTRLACSTTLTHLPESLMAIRIPVDRLREKNAEWRPHIDAVRLRYAERILERPVPIELIRMLADYFYGPRWMTLAAPDLLIDGSMLLVELFQAMTTKGILRHGAHGPAYQLMSTQVHRLSSAAALYADQFPSPPRLAASKDEVDETALPTSASDGRSTMISSRRQSGDVPG